MTGRAPGLALAAAALAAAGCGEVQTQPRPQPRPAPPAFSPVAVAPPFPRSTTLAGAIPGTGMATAYVARHTWLHARPGGKRLVRVLAKTEFGSPRIFSVVERRGPWVAVLASELRNGYVGWLDARRFTYLYRVQHTVEIDLSSRRMTVKRMGRPLLSTSVAIGRPAAPTPKGRFAVTDKLHTGEPAGPYGCCAIALTAHQPHLPQGWGGGDRIAIHATPSPESIGQPVSTGCIRAQTPVMRRLMRELPLGTPVYVRA